MSWASFASGEPLDRQTSCGLPGFRAALEARINAARAQPRMCGSRAMPAVPPLNWDPRLFNAAARHARDMATRNYFSHTGLDGRVLAQRVSAEGYAWTSVGENLAAGEPSVEGVLAGWLSSPGHCSNLMSRDFVEFGVSCVLQPSDRAVPYWALVLARP
ncbi:hypothetical protein B0E41_17625 [Hydrogenophaga sp. A37]|uniref:CAP domain-containing protein n=1 Tax=Hydrogenophaga sp. A37 TaxID=1945864 RepID=UPI0009870A0D|nr:CAP domain-containing protein [Hydrogenophaga sp. A37]OOG81572.1 hypothetical protein B0E41_17625 [Hydrogenophaga sp. A37]